MKWFAFLCFFLICSFSTSVLGEKGNKDEAEKCPPRFHIYMENETLYLNPYEQENLLLFLFFVICSLYK